MISVLCTLLINGCGGGGSDAPAQVAPSSNSTSDNAGQTIQNASSLEYTNLDTAYLAELDDYSATEQRALSYLNTIRTKAGLPPFSINSELNVATGAHSNYLIMNNESGHYETEGKPLFYAVDPLWRSVRAEYGSRYVSENWSSWIGAEENVDGLMGAIYHRMGFLSFQFDEIGIGAVDNGTESSYTYDMGNSRVRELCDDENYDPKGNVFVGLCLNTDKALGEEDFLSADNVAHGKKFVEYPTDGESGAWRFFGGNESPNPIEGYASYSGYPVSVNFNPGEMDCDLIKMKNFGMTDIKTGAEVDVLRILTKSSDEHKSFSTCEFALFPKDREEFEHRYQVSFEYSYKGENSVISWEFKASSPGRVEEVTSADHTVYVSSAEVIYLYFPPIDSEPTIESISTSSTGGSVSELEIFDGNIVKIQFSGNSGDAVTVQSSTRKITVEIR
jgi:uncharacterized protein YkwD